MDPGLVTSLLTVVLARATERILLVLAGALAIYLGYRLFCLIPASANSEGKLEFPGGISIYLARIGPGVFFALFGAGLIGYSATKPIEFSIPSIMPAVAPSLPDQAKTGPQAASQVSGFKYSAITQGDDRPVLTGLKPEVIVAKLNGYAEDARARLDRPAAEELEAAIRAAKLAVMTANWSADWGDRAAFERWVSEGAASDPPIATAQGAVVVFGTVLK